jgi:flagellar hook-basal body complex protein FliE
MSSEAIQAIGAVSSLVAPADAAPTTAVAQPAGGFGQWFVNELGTVNTQLLQAERAAQSLAAGNAVSVHDTMIQIEQARQQFQLAIQVRSRVLEAYQEIMRMQV